MALSLIWIFVSILVLWISNACLSLNRNIAIAKTTGLPYIVSPINGIAGFLWTGIHDIVFSVLKCLPYSQNWLYPMIIYLDPHRGWHYSQELRERHGEAFLIISPGQIYLSVGNADTIYQMSIRRNHFQKPIEVYGIVDLYGKNILTTEKEEWKRHKKVVAPAFSEKSYAVVWKETMNQAHGMLRHWSGAKDSNEENLEVKDTAPDTAVLGLHVISGAAYGISQSWGGDDKELGDNIVPGFNTAKLEGSHRLMFKEALGTLVHDIIWAALAPMWVYSISPFHKKWYQSFIECGDYFNELFDHNLKIIESGHNKDSGAMGIIGSLVEATRLDSSDDSKKMLTKQEAIADSFIFLFAGHETTSNAIHFIILFLAISLTAQDQLQSTLDTVLADRPPESWNYEADFPALHDSFVGAVMNESLRVMSPVIAIPKISPELRQMNVDEKIVTIPANTFLHFDVMGVHRNPRYWPCQESRISDKSHDLDDFVPERWLPGYEKDSKDKASPDASNDSLLFVPRRGAFIPWSEGAHACMGKRFSQVEMMAALAVIFKVWSVELDVRKWASDEEIKKMNVGDGRLVYEKAMDRARKLVKESETVITLKMFGESVPLRFVKRGKERFRECFI
ncbi:hypothetical protein EAE96_001965 [Botrytis aclada]|nr:hypothetical protein EAE96_001965 [Botrytis aclada]